MDVSVEINCELCGSANYSLARDATDETELACNDCGAVQGSLGALKAALLDCVREHSAEAQRARLATIGGTGTGA